MASAKDFKKLMTTAKKAGWRIEQGRKHIKWYAPDNKTLILSSATPGDKRALDNHIALLRKAGLAIRAH